MNKRNKTQCASKKIMEMINLLEPLFALVSKDPLAPKKMVKEISKALSEMRSQYKKSVLNENKTKRGNG